MLGRPAVEIDAAELERLCALQCTEEEIAAWFGVSKKTIERRRKSGNLPGGDGARQGQRAASLCDGTSGSSPITEMWPPASSWQRICWATATSSTPNTPVCLERRFNWPPSRIYRN